MQSASSFGDGLTSGLVDVPRLSRKERRYFIAKARDSAKMLLSMTRDAQGPVEWVQASRREGVQMYTGSPRAGAPLPNSSQVHYVCGITTMQATLEDVAMHYDTSDTKKVNDFVQYEPDVLEQRVLATVVPPSRRKPGRPAMRQITLKWTLLRSPATILRHRDFVTLESQDEFRDPATNRRGWVRCFHSVRLPTCPDRQKTHGYVRASFYHSGYVFIESDVPGRVEAIMCHAVNLKGNLTGSKKLFTMMATRRVAVLAKLESAIVRRRLGVERFLSDLELVPTSDRYRCYVCRTKFGKLQKKANCRKCGEVVCQPCSSVWSIVLPTTGAKRVRMCSRCQATSRQASHPSARSRPLSGSSNSSSSRMSWPKPHERLNVPQVGRQRTDSSSSRPFPLNESQPPQPSIRNVDEDEYSFHLDTQALRRSMTSSSESGESICPDDDVFDDVEEVGDMDPDFIVHPAFGSQRVVQVQSSVHSDVKSFRSDRIHSRETASRRSEGRKHDKAPKHSQESPTKSSDKTGSETNASCSGDLPDYDQAIEEDLDSTEFNPEATFNVDEAPVVEKDVVVADRGDQVSSKPIKSTDSSSVEPEEESLSMGPDDVYTSSGSEMEDETALHEQILSDVEEDVEEDGSPEEDQLLSMESYSDFVLSAFDVECASIDSQYQERTGSSMNEFDSSSDGASTGRDRGGSYGSVDEELLVPRQRVQSVIQAPEVSPTKEDKHVKMLGMYRQILDLTNEQRALELQDEPDEDRLKEVHQELQTLYAQLEELN